MDQKVNSGKLSKRLRRNFRYLKGQIGFVLSAIVILFVLGIGSRAGNYLQKTYSADPDFLSGSFLGDGLMIFGFAIQAGLILFFLDMITKRRERTKLENIRKAAFGLLLSSSERMFNMFESAASY